MRKIFIDGGANRGQSIKAFLKEWPNADQYEIFSFEASSGGDIRNDLNILEEENKNVKIFYKALWVENGSMIFYDDEKTSSSLIKEKPVNYKSKNEVETIDLSSWIKETFIYEDEIILKLDVEGAEYEILEHMVEEGTIHMVNTLFAEIHGSKCGKSYFETKKLIDKIKSVGYKIYSWEAEEFEYEKYENLFYNESFLLKLYNNWSSRGFDRIVQQRNINEDKII